MICHDQSNPPLDSSAGDTRFTFLQVGDAMVTRPVHLNAYEFVALSALRAQQLLAGFTPRLDDEHSAAMMAQMEVAAGSVTHATEAERGQYMCLAALAGRRHCCDSSGRRRNPFCRNRLPCPVLPVGRCQHDQQVHQRHHILAVRHVWTDLESITTGGVETSR